MTLLESLVETAKENLLKFGYVAPVFCLIKQGHILGVLPMAMFDKILGHVPDSHEAKTRDTLLVGVLARKKNADRVVLIWDAAMRRVATKDAKEVMGDVTEQPLLYPKSMRTECIVVNDISLPSGKDSTTVVPYRGGDGELVTFLDIKKEFGGDTPEKIESRFTELVLEGYNSAGEMDHGAL